MARPDVVALREFYASGLGKLVRRFLTKPIHRHWPELGNDTLCGIGYANPILRPYLRQEQGDASLVLSLMPAEQGAIVWPDYGANRTALSASAQLPIADNHLNRIVLMHALEHSDDEERLIAECWRTLTPGGRMIVVVPNRLSIWSSVHHTPFSWGRPYTSSQLRDVVCQQFTHIDTDSALFFFPSRRRWLMRLAPIGERIADWFSPTLGGVLVMEVEKQIYAGVKERRMEFTTKPAFAPVSSKPALSRK